MKESTTEKVTDARNIWNASRRRFYQQEDAMTDLEQLRYPIGRFERLQAMSDRATRAAHIETIEQTPATFLSLTKNRTDDQLDAPYRPGGWTVRQVVHHVPDSHINAYIRMKFAVTEE